MPADPLHTVTAGQPMRVTASTWNEVMRVTRKARDWRADERPTPGDRLGCVAALATNGTGANLAAYSPVGVSGPGPFDLSGADAAVWQRQAALTLEGPDAETSWVAVTLEPIPDGKVGRVAVGGIAVCHVEVTDVGHQYASPAAGDTTRLHSGETGSIRLLFIEAGGGSTRRCVVTVGDQVGDGTGGGGGDPVGVILGNYVGGEYIWGDTASDRIAANMDSGLWLNGYRLDLLEVTVDAPGGVGVAGDEFEAPQDLGWGHKRVNGRLHLTGIGDTRVEGLWHEGGPDGYVDLWAVPLAPDNPAAGYLARAWVDDGRFDPPGFKRGRRLVFQGGVSTLRLELTGGGLGPSYAGGGVQPSLPATVISTGGFAADAVTDVFAGVHVGGTGISGGQRYVGGLWINATTFTSPPPPPPPPPVPPPKSPEPPRLLDAPNKGPGVGGAIAQSQSRMDLGRAIGRLLLPGEDGQWHEITVSGGAIAATVVVP